MKNMKYNWVEITDWVGQKYWVRIWYYDCSPHP